MNEIVAAFVIVAIGIFVIVPLIAFWIEIFLTFLVFLGVQ